jgi:hypothetical protein
MSSLEALFWDIDDFCPAFEPQWRESLLGQGVQRREGARSLYLSEIMTILVGFNQQSYRTFKAYYLKHVCVYWKDTFPALVSYNRLVEWMPLALLPLCVYLKPCFGTCSGISFIDSTSKGRSSI